MLQDFLDAWTVDNLIAISSVQKVARFLSFDISSARNLQDFVFHDYYCKKLARYCFTRLLARSLVQEFCMTCKKRAYACKYFFMGMIISSFCLYQIVQETCMSCEECVCTCTCKYLFHGYDYQQFLCIPNRYLYSTHNKWYPNC